MKMPKATDADKDYFRSVFEDRPDVQVKPMFGQLAAFVVTNQQMCAGLFGSLVGLRLDQDAWGELSAVAGSAAFGPPERPMKEYVSMPEAWRAKKHDSAVEAWVERAIAHSASLPPKKKKAKKPT